MRELFYYKLVTKYKTNISFCYLFLLSLFVISFSLILTVFCCDQTDHKVAKDKAKVEIISIEPNSVSGFGPNVKVKVKYKAALTQNSVSANVIVKGIYNNNCLAKVENKTFFSSDIEGAEL